MVNVITLAQEYFAKWYQSERPKNWEASFGPMTFPEGAKIQILIRPAGATPMEVQVVPELGNVVGSISDEETDRLNQFVQNINNELQGTGFWACRVPSPKVLNGARYIVAGKSVQGIQEIEILPQSIIPH